MPMGKPVSSSAMVSHVDFLPTMASLFQAPQSARADWEGVDYSRIIRDPKAKPVQDYIAFSLGPKASEEQVFAAALRAWSLVHGLSMLILDEQVDRRAAEAMIDRVIGSDRAL